jgi:alpha-mannosidase
LEQGPVRAVYEITGRHQDLTFTTRYTLWSSFPRLDCETVIDFQGKDRRVRALFPLAVQGDARFVCETPFAATERPAGQWPAQNWAAVDWQGAGLALLNTGNQSCQWDGRTLSFTLLRSVSKFSRAWLRWAWLNRGMVRRCWRAAVAAKKKGLNHFETNMYPVHWLLMKWWASPGVKRYHHGDWNFIDQIKAAAAFWQRSDAWERGTHTFCYSLIATGGDWRSENLPRRGWELQAPLLVLPWETEPGERNHFYMQGESLVLSALKPADDGDGLVVRVYDSLGRGGRVRLTSPMLSGTAREILLTEDGVAGEETAVDGSLELDLAPWEIKTLRIQP